MLSTDVILFRKCQKQNSYDFHRNQIDLIAFEQDVSKLYQTQTLVQNNGFWQKRKFLSLQNETVLEIQSDAFV